MAQWVTNLGNIASIIGMGISLYVLFEVRNIKRRFLFKARIPELVASLRKQAKELNSLLRTFDRSANEIEAALSVCEATVANLAPKLQGETRKAARSFQEHVKQRQAPISKEYTYQLYAKLQALIEAVSHVERDINWSA